MRRFANAAKPLVIAVSLRDADPPRWAREVIEGLREDGHEVLCFAPPRALSGFSLLWDELGSLFARFPSYRLYALLEKRAGRPSEDLSSRGGDPIRLMPIQDAEARGCDFLIDLAGSGDTSRVRPRLGAMRLEAGEGPNPIERLRSIAGKPAAPLRAILETGTDKEPVVFEAWVPTHTFSLSRSLNRIRARASALARKTANAVGSGRLAGSVPAGREKQITLGGDPARSLAGVARAALRSALAELVRRKTEQALFVHQWSLVLSTEARDGKRGQWAIVPPADRFWADPFPYRRDGELWLFFEEQLFGAPYARIACAKVLETGRLDRIQTALECPYHLSYPYLVEEGGELYMLPESHQNKSLDLYRCVEFPSRWEKAATLVEGLECADASVFKRPDGWWLLASMRTSGGSSLSEELYAFRSDKLAAPGWTPHPVNPVAIDVRNSRCAGKLFEIDGRLFRPAQDCAGGYGKAVTLHEIVRLDEGEYREEPRATIPAKALRGLATLHTYNCAGNDIVIDGQVRRLRLAAAFASIASRGGVCMPHRRLRTKGADISLLRALAAGYYR